MLPANLARVSRNTADYVNEAIRRQTEENIARVAAAGPDAIGRRLAELDEECDIERAVETLAPSLTLAGMTLGLTVNRKWFLLPFVVQAFFLQHALQGWCPPVPVLRRLGFRTAQEIDQERYALKALRGDFHGIEPKGGGEVRESLEAVRR